MEMIDKFLAWWNSTPTTIHLDTYGDWIIFIIVVLCGWTVINFLIDWLIG